MNLRLGSTGINTDRLGTDEMQLRPSPAAQNNKIYQTVSWLIILILLPLLTSALAKSRVRSSSQSDRGIGSLGAYSVGFRSVVLKDYSRYYNPGQYMGAQGPGVSSARPVQISIWYPASSIGKEHRLTAGRYRLLSNVEKALEDWTESEERAFEDSIVQSGVSRSRSADAVRSVLQTQTMAALDAPIAKGSFPLIIYGPSMIDGVQGNTVLYEYLASHGYIVAAHPSFGVSPRMMDTGHIGLETQVRDMEFVLGFMKQTFAQHIGPIGVMGHSWGGMAAAVVGMRHADVSTVLSLDSSVEQWRDLVLTLADYDLTKLRQPFMHIQGGENTDHGFYRSIKYAPKYRITFLGLKHFDVVSAEHKAVGAYNQKDNDSKRYMYNLVNQFVLSFFDAYLKQQPGALNSLISKDGSKSSVPSIVGVEWNPGHPAPPTEGEIVGLIVGGQFEKAEKIIRAAKADDPEAYSEAAILQIGELVFWSWRHFPESLRFFSLAAQYYPQSARIHEMLGNVYSTIGKTEEAIKSYQRCLELDSANLRVRHNLDSLKLKK